MRKTWLIFGGAVVVGLVAFGIGVWYLRTAVPEASGTRAVAGAGAPVEVWRDSLGVPHVWARSAEDLFYAQGYVHAQDRLWQLELFRRVAEGRLAEVMGEELLETDRFLRTIGLWRAAAATERNVTGELRGWMESYAAGVNAWIARRQGALPPEFLALRIRPEPWTVRHTLAVEKIMALDLSAYEIGVEVARAARRLGPEKARLLLPGYPAWGATIVETPVPPAVPRVAADLIGSASITRASNSWVVAGARTRSGKPILANDMHLQLRAPSVWYLMALHAPGIDVAGMTLAGVPFVVAGHNKAVAWGYTNAYVDDVDLFVERLDPADSTRYLTPTGSEPFRVAADTIRVKGRKEPVIFPVRWTRHGPILTPVEERTGGELIALRWAAHDPSNTWRALPALNRASNWDEFLKAVDDFDDPHQNVIYADTAGHIGYYMGGRVPIRGRGGLPPLGPVPGWTGDWDWTGDLPFEEHPHVLDPPEGYVVTANNRQAAGEAGERISTYWEQPFRAERIREMIRAGGALDAASMHRMQLDVRDVFAVRYRDRAADAAKRAGLAAEAALLRSWDLEAARDSRGAALFYLWYQHLRRLAARDVYGGEGWVPREAVDDMLERGEAAWAGTAGQATYRRLTEDAMKAAAPGARGKTWGELHEAVSAHALAPSAFLRRGLDLNVGPAPIGGSPTTVNVTHYRGSEPPFVTFAGVSQRHVVDMADVDGPGGFILPTGQSGVPFSPHYRDQFARWRRGGLWPIPLERAAAERRAVARMVLQPEAR